MILDLAKTPFKLPSSPDGVPMLMPLSLGLNPDGSDLWMLPYEPLITIDGGKEIVYRNVSKRRDSGTVKELWSLKDTRISVEGMFMGKDEKYPETEVSKFRKLCEAKQSLLISCPLTTLLGIELVVVESWRLPNTPGNGMQGFSMTLVSDRYFDLT